MSINWFFFDLGNTLIKLDYERVMAAICRDATVERNDLVELLEQPGGYRDLELGAATFTDFYEFICARAGYRGTIGQFRDLWANFFGGAMPGIEDLLERIRKTYRIAFLSNSNEVHAEVIPRQFAALFRKDDRFIFSHRHKLAKPDPEMFHRALEVVGTLPQHAALVDDMLENVIAARQVGMTAFQFSDTPTLVKQLEGEGLLEKK